MTQVSLYQCHLPSPSPPLQHAVIVDASSYNAFSVCVTLSLGQASLTWSLFWKVGDLHLAQRFS